MSAIMGAAMSTERPMLRTGARVSPARMATYSKPLSAPRAILLKIFKLKRVAAGVAHSDGRVRGNYRGGLGEKRRGIRAGEETRSRVGDNLRDHISRCRRRAV